MGKFLSLTGVPLSSKELQFFGLVKKVVELEDEDLEKIRKFTHSEPFFISLKDNKDSFYKHQISRRRDAERSMAEFLERSKSEDHKEVLL